MEKQIIRETYYSNQVITYVILKHLSVEMSIDRSQTILYDTLRLSISLKNTSAVLIPKIELACMIPNGALYVKNSLRINGNLQWGWNVLTGVSLKALKGGECIKLDFQVVISEKYIQKSFSCRTEIVYDSIYDISKPPMPICMDCYSKDIPVAKIIEKEEEPVHSIMNGNCRTDYLVEVVDTQVETVCEKIIQNENEYSVLVIAGVTYHLNIIRGRCRQRICCSFGITSLIKVKSGIRLCTVPQAEVLVKEVGIATIGPQILLYPKLLIRLKSK